MRITQTMLQNNMLRNLFQSQAQMDKYLTQINTGKKIRKPSEDPIVAMKGIDYRTQVTEVEQYRRNASEIWNWMDHSDDVLDKATKAVQRIEYLAVQAANDSYSADERESIKQEVEQLQEQLVELANTQVNGKYIFNGTNTDQAPIVKKTGEDGEEVPGYQISYHPDEVYEIKIEVSKGIEFPANTSPVGIFDQELFDNIQNFINDLDPESEEEADFDERIEELNESSLNII